LLHWNNECSRCCKDSVGSTHALSQQHGIKATTSRKPESFHRAT
jgi:hypothetical protein